MELAADSSRHYHDYLRSLEGVDRGLFLINHLNLCAKFIEDGDFKNANIALKDIAYVASPDGDTIQRLATYCKTALTHRLMIDQIGHVPTGLFSCLINNPWSTLERKHSRNLSFDFLPFLKFSYLITNQAIVDEMQREQEFHIIDLNPTTDNATQLIYLLHTLKAQCQGINPLPRVKITMMIHENNNDILQRLRSELTQEAEKLNFHVDLHVIVGQLENVCFEKVPWIKPGEPIAISCVLGLHSLLAVDDDQINNPNYSDKIRGFLLQLHWKLKPRLMVITEQESDNNRPSLSERLGKALNLYAPFFDCLEANVPKERGIERIMVERTVLGEEIKNIIACDGVDRKERHGKFFETWSPWLKLAGFKGMPMNYGKMLEMTRSFMQRCGNG